MKKRLFFLILCSMLLATAPALAKDPDLVKNGYKFYNKGYISKAIPTFQQAVSAYPDNARAHLGLALSAFKQGGDQNFEIAKIHFKQTLDLDPNNYEALTNLARILSWDPSARSEALHLYRRALAIKPNDKEVQYQLAEVLNWSGNNYEAAELFKPIYDTDPNNPDIAVKYANALANSGSYYESLPLYKKGISAKIRFDHYTALSYARALAKTGNSALAARIYTDVIELTKNDDEKINIKKELAAVLFDTGNYQEAIDVDSSIPAKTKDVLLRLARANDKLQNTQEAVQIFEDAFNLYPYDEDVQRSAAQYLAKIGGYNITATKIYEKLIESGSATPDDTISLAYLYNSSDNTRDKAIELFREILQNPGLNNAKTEELNLALARALGSNENTRPEAVQIFRQILTNNPDDQSLQLEFLELLSWQDATRHEALVGYFELINKYPDNPKVQNGFNQTISWYLPTESDISLYEQILKKYPDNVHAIKGLAFLASQYTDDKAKALELYNKLLTYSPDNYDIQYQIANLLASSDDTRKDAIDLYKKLHNQHPEDLDVTVALANNLLYTKKFKQAKTLYNEILNKDTENKDALLGTARIYGWQGLNLAALKAYSKVYEIYPMDPDIAYEYANIAKKLGNNAKALEILRKINKQSYLPDAPGLPEIAMAVNYQVMSIENHNPNPMATPNNLNKIQNDLDSIQKSIEDLEKQLESLQKVNHNLENNYSAVTTSTTRPLTSERQSTDISNTYKENEISPFMIQKESLPDLPEPVTPGQNAIYQRITYSENNRRLEDLGHEQPAVFNNNTEYDEVVLNPGQPSNCFRMTGFEDALAGRRYNIMHDLFGNLESDIMYDMRPELRTSFVLSNEAGDPTSDGLEMHGFPSFGSINITPQNRFRFGITSATYGMSTAVNPASITATSYILGLTSRPHERVMFDGELAINSFSDPNAPVDVTARTRLEIKAHDRLRLNLGYRREPLYQSTFESTGHTLRPQYTPAQLTSVLNRMVPFAGNWVDMDPNLLIQRNRLAADSSYYGSMNGPFMGQVRDNAVSAEVTFIPFNKWDVNAGYEYSAVRGENIEHNGRHQAIFSVGRTFTGVKDHLFRLGYQFLFFGYRKDLSAFPNMTPYPYTVNGRILPVTRQMRYEEINAYLNDVNYPYVDPRVVYNSVDPTNPLAPIPAGPYSSPFRFIAAPDKVGIGGYFSPTQFYLNSFRFDFEGKVLDGRLYYKGGASLGVQQIGDRVDRMALLGARHLEQYANIAPNDPRMANAAFRANANAANTIRDTTDPTSLASAFDLTMFLKITDFMTLYSGVDYMNTGAFDRWRYNGGVIFRPAIKALTPVFRKPEPEPAPASDNENTGGDTEQ